MRGGAPLRAGDGGSGATEREATPGLVATWDLRLASLPPLGPSQAKWCKGTPGQGAENGTSATCTVACPSQASKTSCKTLAFQKRKRKKTNKKTNEAPLDPHSRACGFFVDTFSDARQPPKNPPRQSGMNLRYTGFAQVSLGCFLLPC